MLHEIGRLREIAACCQAGTPLSEEAARWLGGSLERFLTQKCPTIEAAMGLSFARGGVPWWKEEAIRRRDAALRALAVDHFDGLGPTRRAAAICRLANRYAAAAWRFDRERNDMPPAYRGTPKANLWQAFRSGAAMPISERQLRKILK